MQKLLAARTSRAEEIESLERIKMLNYVIDKAMKEYKKAKMIAKNLPTGSYAAGCPQHTPRPLIGGATKNGQSIAPPEGCRQCEITA